MKGVTFAIILAAAGKSSRFGGEATLKKPFVSLLGQAVWLHSAEKFATLPNVRQQIIVVSPDDPGWFRDQYAAEIDRLNLTLVVGGAERVDSVQNALAAVEESIDFVAIHDAARPCVTTTEIDAVFAEVRKHDAAMLASPIIGTVKRVVDHRIEATVDRRGLWEAQTPQVFRRQLLLDAYAQRGREHSTDDAELVERIGYPVFIVPADRWNLKITTQTDLRLAEMILLGENEKNKRLA